SPNQERAQSPRIQLERVESREILPNRLRVHRSRKRFSFTLELSIVFVKTSYLHANHSVKGIRTSSYLSIPSESRKIPPLNQREEPEQENLEVIIGTHYCCVGLEKKSLTDAASILYY
ncbi:MAG: hypothetical protein KJ927_09775, partial [Candidatus Eisenbacteria bacterium]|nr:hypothetical protein [Candidatus Eisenbacteria bacterium]